MKRPGCMFAFCLLLGGLAPSSGHAADVVRAAIERETAWIGEPVTIAITLYSPAPFSGVASFDLPELPQTVILRTGSPVVGSETIDDETMFTQRHELSLLTQRAGEIVIPSFRVQFASQQTFSSDPVPMKGETAELRFQSKRPPGTQADQIVIATNDLKVTQAWSPDSSDSIAPGDVVERTISRQAAGTSAMLLPPVSNVSLDGIRTYPASPVVEDDTDRGVLIANRTDRVRYQFERAGTFELPDIEFVWWVPDSNKLQKQTLVGKTIHVTGTSVDIADQGGADRLTMTFFMGLILLGGGLLYYRYAGRLGAWWQATFRTRERLAAKSVFAACRANDARATYAAGLQWMRTVAAVDPPDAEPDFARQWSALSDHLFGTAVTNSSWSGRRFAKALMQLRRQANARMRRSLPSALPPLNPDHPPSPASKVH